MMLGLKTSTTATSIHPSTINLNGGRDVRPVADVVCNHFFPLKVECREILKVEFREILKKERKFNFFFFKRRGESGIFAPSIRKNDLFDFIDGK